MKESNMLECSECASYQNILKKIEFFHSVSEEIMEKKPLDELLNDILNASKQLLDSEASSLLLYDKESDLLYFHIAKGEKGEAIESQYVNMGQGIAGWVAEYKKEQIINDCYSDPRFNPDFDKKTGFRTCNMMCSPMIRNGELVGVLQVINKHNNKLYLKSDMDFFTALCSQCAIAIENARLAAIEVKSEQIKHELETARKIQENILPKRIPKFADLDIDVKLVPAMEIGGDYYDIVEIDDDHTLVLVTDVTGKSVPAALIVSTIYSFIKTYLIINTESFNLLNFVEALNKFLIFSTTPDKFATAWFGLFIHSTKELESISAGHNPTYYYNHAENKLIELNKGGLFLGSLEFPYESEKIRLADNDTVVFYTDGITEAMDKNEEEYGEERFKETILNNLDSNSNLLLNSIIRDVNSFRQTAQQSDDITCGVIKLH